MKRIKLLGVNIVWALDMKLSETIEKGWRFYDTHYGDSAWGIAYRRWSIGLHRGNAPCTESHRGIVITNVKGYEY